MNEKPPGYVVAAAAMALVETALYWPGKDYPDREVWLAKRAAQRVKPPVVTVYRNTSRQPLALGINNAKRMADAEGDGNSKHTRGKSIVRHRHGYYRDRHESGRS